MPVRRLPVRPDLDQLRHQAKELLRAARRGDAEAAADFAHFHPDAVEPASARLHDAQLVLARSYQAPSWTRLVQACRLVEAIWRDDLETVRTLVTKHPRLLREQALIRPDSNWGPPLSYAANLGRDWGRSHESILHLRASRDVRIDVDAVRIPYNAHTTRYPERVQAVLMRRTSG